MTQRDDEYSISVADLLRIDSLCDEFECQFERGQSDRIDDFVRGVPRRLQSLLRSELRRVHQDLAVTVESQRPGQASSNGFSDDQSVGVRIGRFTLTEKLGSGGSSVVWKAKDVGLDRWVAIKVPHQTSFVESGRFLREARLSARLQHPNIVRVLEVHQNQDRCYLVQELVQGVSLEEWLTVDRRDCFRTTANILMQLADTLAYSHGVGVIHRDLKPHNVLIDSEDVPHVVDFGLAATIGTDSSTITRSGQWVGTPAYIAPEQLRDGDHAVGERSDVYALGVVMYRMLTGVVPFRGSLEQVFRQVLETTPQSPRVLNREVPQDLETICRRCMEKRPDDRFESAAQLRDELRRYLDGRPILSRPLSAWSTTYRWARRNRRLAAMTAVAAACLIFVAFGSLAASIQLNRSWQREHEQRVAAEESARIAYDAQQMEAAARLSAVAARGDAERNFARAEAEMLVSRQSFQFLQALFESSDPVTQTVVGIGVDEGPRTVRDVLAIASRRAEKEFQHQPRVQARLMDLLGNASRGVGAFEQAQRLLDKATELRETSTTMQEGPKLQIQVARNLFYRAWLQHDRGQYAVAEQTYRQAQQAAVAAESGDELLIADIDFQLGRLLTTIRRNQESSQCFANSLAIRQRHLPADSNRVRAACVGLRMSQSDGSPGSMAMIAPLLIGSGPAHRVALQYAQVLRYRAANDYESAWESYQSLTSSLAESLGQEHPLYLIALGDYAGVAFDAGKLEIAFDAAREAVEKGAKLAPRHPQLRSALLRLAEETRRADRFGEATAYYQRALAIERTETRRFDYQVHEGLAWCFLKRGDGDQALTHANQLISHVDKYAMEMTAWAFFTHARCLEAVGERQSVAEFDGKAEDIAAGFRDGTDHPMWLARLSAINVHTNHLDVAERLQRRALQSERTRRMRNHPRIATQLIAISQILYQRQKLDEARQNAEEAMSIYVDTLPRGDIRIERTKALLAKIDAHEHLARK